MQKLASSNKNLRQCSKHPNTKKRYQSNTLKRILYKKQNTYCNGCEKSFEINNLEKDHIVSIMKGGCNCADNIQLLCKSCNMKKGAYLSTDDIKKHKSKKLSDYDVIKKKNKIKVECDNHENRVKIRRQKYANSAKVRKWQQGYQKRPEAKERRRERDADPKRENIEESIGISHGLKIKS